MFEGYFTTCKIIIVFRNFVSENSVYWYTFFFLFPHEKSEIILIFVLLYVLWLISLAAVKFSLYHCFPVVWFLCLSCLMFISFLDFHHFEKKLAVILLHTVLTHYFFPLILKWYVCLTTWCCSTNHWGFLHFACFISFCLCASV